MAVKSAGVYSWANARFRNVLRGLRKRRSLAIKMSQYFERKKIIEYQKIPRLPLLGALDLTYRCNNNCRHCWRWIPNEALEENKELSCDEIYRIVDAARAMGCRMWSISGGEPMIRPDFADIFDYITTHSSAYDLNTNGTLITPKIARLMRRKGSKKIALCGASAEVHDRITRNPGSFEATLRGCAYLKEAGAGFSVQLIPVRDNIHQFNQMVELARSISPSFRIGAVFYYLTAWGSMAQNTAIIRERLHPRTVTRLDVPVPSFEDPVCHKGGSPCRSGSSDDHVFEQCLANRRDFHIDPYGGFSFCIFISDPELRYDLRSGSFQKAWEEFIPSLADRVRGGREYLEGCAVCDLRQDCRWCPAYAYLEHRRYGAKVEYLCRLARDAHRFKKKWSLLHRRYYGVAGITFQVDSDRPFKEKKLDARLRPFRLEGPGSDIIEIRHHFDLPDGNDFNLGPEVYGEPPWFIYRKDSSWVYINSPSRTDHTAYRQIAVFSQDHTRGRIYNSKKGTLRRGPIHSLTFFPTDQIVLARVLADRQAFILHSCAAILDGHGLIFLGHSGAGKSSLTRLLRHHAEILCDDRNVVRRWPDGIRVHGTWSHGDVAQVSSASAPLRAILFLQQADENRFVSIKNRREITRQLLGCLIKPLVTADWWEKVLGTVQWVVREVPFYEMKFDLSGKIIGQLKQWLHGKPEGDHS